MRWQWPSMQVGTSGQTSSLHSQVLAAQSHSGLAASGSEPQSSTVSQDALQSLSVVQTLVHTPPTEQ
jgi:hypothetical protein